jgi:hypothetical protein
VEAGLADVVDGDPSAQDSFDLSMFLHPPEELLHADNTAGGERQPTKREIERALRDAGLTRGQAKAFVAAAWANGDSPNRVAHEDAARDVADLIALRDALKSVIG